MKSYLLASALLMSLLAVAHAQQDVDQKYIAIYDVIQQAENLAENGDPKQALASLTDVQNQLQQFQKVYPDWNPGIISYRLGDVAQQIATVKAKLAANPSLESSQTTSGVPAQAAQLSAQEKNLAAQLQAAQAENKTLQAKLKEALSIQPNAVDSSEWSKAQEQIRALVKENELLKANATVERSTNNLASLRRQLAAALDKSAAAQSQEQKLVAANTALQQELKQADGKNSAALDQLRNENDRLKVQLAAVQSAANNATAAGDLTNKLKAANTQIASLESTVTVMTLEKSALEDKVKQLSADMDKLRVADNAGQIQSLTAQRDALAKELADTGRKGNRSKDAAALTALTSEVQTLQARLAVAEAKPAPYSDEELALLRQNAPQASANGGEHSVQELPAGAAELVASAQQHFSNHEFSAAEADYLKILKHDKNNVLVLANLATIEMQEDKLAEAEKHIDAAVAQNPNDAYNLSTLGYLKFRQEKYDEALDALSRAAKLDPNNPEIQNYLGVTLSHKGLREQAEAALRKAIEINPQYAPAHNNLAVVYLNETPPMPLLARWHYEKAIAAGQPRNPDLEKLLAEKGAPVSPQ